MVLPMKLWLPLQDDVERHKTEIARNFAEARARLLPESITTPPDGRDQSLARHLSALQAAAMSRNPYLQGIGGYGGLMDSLSGVRWFLA